MELIFSILVINCIISSSLNCFLYSSVGVGLEGDQDWNKCIVLYFFVCYLGPLCECNQKFYLEILWNNLVSNLLVASEISRQQDSQVTKDLIFILMPIYSQVGIEPICKNFGNPQRIDIPTIYVSNTLAVQVALVGAQSLWSSFSQISLDFLLYRRSTLCIMIGKDRAQ